MAKISFNFKDFLLKYGERVGFGVAAGVMGLMLLSGLVKFFSSGSAVTNARTLESEATAKKQAMASAQPDKDLSYVNPDLLTQNVSGPVDGFLYPLSQELVEAGTITDSKRRPPRVLAPEQISATVVWAQIDGIGVSESSKGELVKIVENGAPKKDKGSGLRDLNEMGGPGGMRGMMGGMGAGGMGGGRGGMGGRFGGGDGGPGGGDMSMFMSPNSKAAVKWVAWKDFERLQQKGNVRLADVLTPHRLVYVVGAFPYKKEVEEFQTKLRYATIYDLLADPTAMPQFKRLEVQRRTIRPDGKPQPVLAKDGKPGSNDGWAPLDIKEQTLEWLVLTGGQTEPDDDRIAEIAQYGLALPRPKLMVDREYPKLEEKLELIKKTLDSLEGKDKIAVAPPPSLKDKSRYDPFSPTGKNPNSLDPNDMLTPGGVPGGPGGAPGPGGAAGPGGTGKFRPGGGGRGDDVAGGAPGRGGLPGVPGGPGGTFTSLQDTPIPDHLVLRFLDLDVKPGETYEYRVSIVMVNPNYQKPNVAWDSVAKDEELVGDWFVLPQRVTVPPDLRYYAVEEKTEQGRAVYPALFKDQAALQIHRWVETLAPSPTENRKDRFFPVGDWLIADHVLAYKGERVNHTEREYVPTYDPIDDSFVLYGLQWGSKGRGGMVKSVEVAFGTLKQDIVLLDITGGKQEYARAGGAGKKAAELPREVLLLTADGRIEVRNQDQDTIDQDRIERRKTWIERIRDLRNPRPVMPFGPGGPGGDRGGPGGGS